MRNFTKIALAASLLAAMFMLPSRASAQATSSGTLTVNATVQPSISMVFDSASGGIVLTGAGSNAATLSFGGVSAYYTEPSGVTGSNNPSSSQFTVTASFDVNVSEANSSSASYALTAQLGSADSTNSWSVDSTAINSTSATAIGGGSYSYAGDVAHSVSITIPYSSTSNVSNTISFVATAN